MTSCLCSETAECVTCVWADTLTHSRMYKGMVTNCLRMCTRVFRKWTRMLCCSNRMDMLMMMTLWPLVLIRIVSISESVGVSYKRKNKISFGWGLRALVFSISVRLLLSEERVIWPPMLEWLLHSGDSPGAAEAAERVRCLGQEEQTTQKAFEWLE